MKIQKAHPTKEHSDKAASLLISSWNKIKDRGFHKNMMIKQRQHQIPRYQAHLYGTSSKTQTASSNHPCFPCKPNKKVLTKASAWNNTILHGQCLKLKIFTNIDWPTRQQPTEIEQVDMISYDTTFLSGIFSNSWRADSVSAERYVRKYDISITFCHKNRFLVGEAFVAFEELHWSY